MRFIAPLCLLVLAACPWVAGPPPSQDTSCVGSDCIVVCDSTPASLQREGTLSGQVCDGFATAQVGVEAGCEYTLALSAALPLEVEVFDPNGGGGVAFGDATQVTVMATTTDVLRINLFGESQSYSMAVTETCPPCGGPTQSATWESNRAGRLCPAPDNSVRVEVSGGWVRCDQSLNVHSSDRGVMEIQIVDAGGRRSVYSTDSGLFGVAGAVLTADGPATLTVRQSPESDVEQGVWMSFEQYCE